MRDNWCQTRLGEIAEIILGGTPSTSVEKYWKPEVNWITAKDISGSPTVKIYTTERKISKEGIEHSAARILPALTTVIIVSASE